MKMMKAQILFMCLMLTSSVFAQKIGLLMDSYFLDRWYTDQKLLHDKIVELGGVCITEDPNGDVDEQIKLGRKLIREGVDALIVIPIDSKKTGILVEEAKAAKIPVIAYDRLIAHKDLDFYISYDNSKVGINQAKYALSRVAQGNYLLINGPVSDNNAVLFREGQLSVLKPAIDAGKVKVIADIVLNDWSEMEAMMKVDEFISKSIIKPDVIIAGNDGVATGALQALPASLLGKVIVIGQDAESMAIRNIIKGDQAMTVYKPIKPLAHRAAEIAINLSKGSPVPDRIKFKSLGLEVNAMLLEPVVVDKANYRETVVKDGHVKADLK